MNEGKIEEPRSSRPSSEPSGNLGSLLADLEDLIDAEVTLAPAPELNAEERPRPCAELSTTPGAEIITQFRSQDAAASVEEQVLHLAISGEWNVHGALLDAKAKLTAKLLDSIDEPRVALLVARVMRDVVHLDSSLAKRIESMLLASASLRHQRRLLSLHAGNGRANGI